MLTDISALGSQFKPDGKQRLLDSALMKLLFTKERDYIIYP